MKDSSVRVARATTDLRTDLARALARSPRQAPTRYLYDARGAALFEQILHLPEYYQARTETALLHAHAESLIDEVGPDGVIELGVGSGDKTELLLAALARLGGTRRAIVHDVHAASASRAAMVLDRLHEGVSVRAATGDFLRELPSPPSGRLLWAMLGSTFGNLSVSQGRALLSRLAERSQRGDGLLLGVDLAHDRRALVRAYDDEQGVTAAFNLNALTHLNRVAGADFEVSGFSHVARFDEASSRIEMLLEATRPMRLNVRSIDLSFRLERGELLRTEISEKHTEASLAARAAGTAWGIGRFVADERRRYALVLFVRERRVMSLARRK